MYKVFLGPFAVHYGTAAKGDTNLAEKGLSMAADTWISDITHFLDQNGNLIEEPKEARVLADYFVAIIVMAYYPDPDYPPAYRVSCRRRPQRKPCREEIVGFIDPESDDVVWICPKCNDRGLISNWQGTIWDMSERGDVEQ